MLIGYCRCSTRHQLSDDKHGLEHQRAAIEEYAAKRGEQVTIYTDEGVSGKNVTKRPQLQKAVEHACKLNTYLVVLNLSRFSRSIIDSCTLSEKLRKGGGGLVSLQEQIDDSPNGRLMANMLVCLAQWQREIISQNVRETMAHCRKQNRRLSSRVPYGYDADDAKGLTENEFEMAFVREIEAMKAKGVSANRIAGELNARGVPTKQGKAWSHATVLQTLERRAKLTA